MLALSSKRELKRTRPLKTPLTPSAELSLMESPHKRCVTPSRLFLTNSRRLMPFAERIKCRNVSRVDEQAMGGLSKNSFGIVPWLLRESMLLPRKPL
jgi:hypothetical protein